ncbi:hypothetical protein DFQ30_003932 [Apophysomyces sp. BC1015]|nr:hypothetical protein DFQ30_003932 [Apophysomyces sp. BC1015]KAG0177284.1 hypothetical protein DFQ29_005022 [Apophysomyces sp. BC1021]
MEKEDQAVTTRAPFWRIFSKAIIASAFVGIALLHIIRVEVYGNLARLDRDEWKEFMKSHPYERMFNGRDVSRSPCPALNTLANHGLIARNGRNITFDELYRAVKVVGLAPVSSYLTLLYVYSTFHSVKPTDSFWDSFFKTANTIDLDDLANHNLLEHDVSMSRHDLDLAPHDVITPAPDRVALMIQFATDGVFTAQNQYDYRKARWLESIRDNRGLYLSTFLQLVAGTECAVSLEVLGRDNSLRVDHLQSFFIEERFPDDWYPREQPFSGTELLWKTMQCFVGVRRSPATLENTPHNALAEEKQTTEEMKSL